MSDWIYLDNNATTKPLDEVVQAMEPFLRDRYANPSSFHRFGQEVRHAVEQARDQVAGLIGAEPREIVFTSGGTESINLGVRGLLASRGGRTKVVISAVEHSAGRRLAARFAQEGFQVDEIGVDGGGQLAWQELEEKLTADTALVSVIHANNETGVLTDAKRVCELAARYDVPVHLDAVQSVGKVSVNVSALPVHLLSMSGHKLHGPKGVGALYVRRRTRLAPLAFGGRQERDLRPGTENVAGIVGFGVAAEEASGSIPERMHAIRQLRDRFEERVVALIPEACVIGRGSERVGNTSNLGFARLQAEALLLLLSERGVCASAGAACSSGSLEPSHVLRAMGVDSEVAHGAVRFSLSRFTTESELERAVAALVEVVARLREGLPAAPARGRSGPSA